MTLNVASNLCRLSSLANGSRLLSKVIFVGIPLYCISRAKCWPTGKPVLAMSMSTMVVLVV